MTILRFIDSNSRYAGIPFDLEVPDYPYDEPRHVKDGNEYRIAVSPLEFANASDVVKVFINSIPPAFIKRGIDKMQIVDGIDGIVSTWRHVLILPFENNFGTGIEFTALERDVS